ncbi:hypothetical protein ACR80L_13145 [Bacillus velezensis]|uniref:hypothetical protein n=1 Tax=Bacillus velezensis TaxID=492670 RepID=UPI003F5BD584
MIFFQRLPADFRLIGARRRMPIKIPPGYFVRAVLKYFSASWKPPDLNIVATKAAEQNSEQTFSDEALSVLTAHCAKTDAEAVKHQTP